MAPKRRHRRTEIEPNRWKVSDETSKGNQTDEFDEHRRLPISSSTIFFVVLFLLACSFVVYWGSRSTRKAPPPPLSVYERGIVKTDVCYKEILNENARVIFNRSIRHFPNPVLAYITPWNSRGYEVAKKFTSKFTHISPVWYELKSKGKKLFLDGRDNADKHLVSDLSNNGNVLVLPRIVLEAFPADLLLKRKQWSKACDIILRECREMEYDGIVLESWSRWARYGVLHDPEMRKMCLGKGSS